MIILLSLIIVYIYLVLILILMFYGLCLVLSFMFGLLIFFLNYGSFCQKIKKKKKNRFI